jgi:signal peptidase I
MPFLSRSRRGVPEAGHGKSKFRESIESLVFTLVFVWVFTNHIAQATEVPTESMKPTILAGDHFFLDKLAFPANYPGALQKYLPERTIRRGDIVAFWSPENRQMRLVKRVIGLPGDTVEIRARQVYINGKPLAESYKVHIDPNTYPPAPWVPEALQKRDNFGPAVVPPNQYFMMGDNRDNSNDSRYWGFARRESFIGKPLFIYWSFESEPNDSMDWSLKDYVHHYTDVAEHLFTKTRWLRTGELVK